MMTSFETAIIEEADYDPEEKIEHALKQLLSAVRQEVAEEEKVSREDFEFLRERYEAQREVIQEQEEELVELRRRNQGMLNHLQRIRTKADMASGFDNISGSCEEASAHGRSAGAEGAVDRLIALYAGKLHREKENAAEQSEP